jgi:hypothetical protein
MGPWLQLLLEFTNFLLVLFHQFYLDGHLAAEEKLEP